MLPAAESGQDWRFLRRGSHAQRHRRRRVQAASILLRSSASIENRHPLRSPHRRDLGLTLRGQVRQCARQSPQHRYQERRCAPAIAPLCFLETITICWQSGIASSSATVAPLTCPIPPIIIASKFCFIPRTSAQVRMWRLNFDRSRLNERPGGELRPGQ